MPLRRTFLILILLAVAYYASVIAILRFDLDPFMFPHSQLHSTLPVSNTISVSIAGNQLLIRRYGTAQRRCVVYFPGQHGNQPMYTNTVFPALLKHHIVIYAISYPGQDGAKGRTRLAQLPQLLNTGLSKLDASCPFRNAVFVGRSLGSMVAVIQAGHWHPGGMLLDSTSPSLSAAIKTYLAKKWFLYPASGLPIHRIIAVDYSLPKLLSRLPDVRIVVIQGSADTKTPAAAASQAVAGFTNVEFIDVAGARHSNTYIKAKALYVQKIIELLTIHHQP